MPRRFIKNDGVVEREVRGSLILVPLGGDAPRIDCLYTLNTVARCIWRQAVEGTTEDSIVASVVREYDVDENTARRDCSRVLDELAGVGALTVSE